MDFFQSFLRALGFGNSSDNDLYDEEEGIDATVVPRKRLGGNGSEDSDNEEINAPEITVEESEEKIELNPETIFAEVLDVFNASLPEFIRNSIDPQAQQKALYDTLSESVRKYIESTGAKAVEITERRWAAQRKKLTKEVESLSAKLRSSEQSEAETKKNQLSAERQKRAMNERMHDLEQQIANLQAEQEQFSLENKSMQNKVRAAAIYEEDNEKLREEIAELSEKIKNGPSPALSPEEIAEIEKLRSDNTSLLNDIETAKAKIELSDRMLSSQTNISAELRQKLADANNEIESLKAENQSLKEKLTEAESNMETLAQIEDRISKFEDIKKRKETRIAELTAEKAALAEDARLLETEVAALKKTIERNLHSQSKNESALKSEIESLKHKLQKAQAALPDTFTDEPFHGVVAEAQSSHKTRKARASRKIKISAIDETLDNTDWLVSTPPDRATTIAATKPDTDAEFGYTPPVRKTPPVNDAQMLLFD